MCIIIYMLCFGIFHFLLIEMVLYIKVSLKVITWQQFQTNPSSQCNEPFCSLLKKMRHFTRNVLIKFSPVKKPNMNLPNGLTKDKLTTTSIPMSSPRMSSHRAILFKSRSLSFYDLVSPNWSIQLENLNQMSSIFFLKWMVEAHRSKTSFNCPRKTSFGLERCYKFSRLRKNPNLLVGD